MQVFWIFFSHFPYLFCAHCIPYSKNLYFYQYTSNYLFVFCIITFRIFSGGLPERTGFRESRRSALSSHCRNVTAAIRNSYRKKQGEEIRMRPRPLRPVFFSLSIIHYTRNFLNCVIFLTFFHFIHSTEFFFNRPPGQYRRLPHTPWQHRLRR